MEKRLYRTRRNKMIGGVSSGLAEYFNIDPVLIRIVFVILAFQHGIGFLAYIILWIVVPMKIEAVDLAFEHGGGNVGTDGGKAGADGGKAGADGGDAGSIDAEFKEETAGTPSASSDRRTMIGGIALIVLGALFLLDNFFPGFDFEHFWPLLLIAVGTGMLWNSIPRSSDNEVTS